MPTAKRIDQLDDRNPLSTDYVLVSPAGGPAARSTVAELLGNTTVTPTTTAQFDNGIVRVSNGKFFTGVGVDPGEVTLDDTTKWGAGSTGYLRVPPGGFYLDMVLPEDVLGEIGGVSEATRNKADGFAGLGVDAKLFVAQLPTHPHTVSQLSDATAVGKSLATAIDAAAGRTAIGAAAAASPAVTGTLAIQQLAGIAGKDELQIFHDGSHSYLISQDGELRFVGKDSFNTFPVAVSRRLGGKIFDGLSWGASWEWLFDGIDRQFRLGSAWTLTWSSSPGDANAVRDLGLRRSAAGVLEINNSAAGQTRDLSLRNLTASGTVTLGTYTVGTLPSASANAGAFAQVTDSNSTTNGSIVAGGGSNRVPVFSNGTNWIIK
jgi:hypothetical protein